MEKVTCTLSCVRSTAGEKLLHNTGSPASRSVMTQRGRELRKEGKCVWFWLIPVAMQWKPTQHCGAIFLQLKNNKKN